jgi:hypothetical protein
LCDAISDAACLLAWLSRCAVAGITSDAHILLNYARLEAQRYFYTYQVSHCLQCA